MGFSPCDMPSSPIPEVTLRVIQIGKAPFALAGIYLYGREGAPYLDFEMWASSDSETALLPT